MTIYVITEDYGYDGQNIFTVDCSPSELELIRKNYKCGGDVSLTSLDEWVASRRMSQSKFDKLIAKPKKGIWWLAVSDIQRIFSRTTFGASQYQKIMLNYTNGQSKVMVKHFHVTLAYDVTRQDRPDNYYKSKFDGDRKIGEYTPVHVRGLAYNDKCACLVVSGIRDCCNKVAHITLATADGVKPVYSNDMLAGVDGAYSFLPLEAELEGQLEFFEFS